MNRFDLARVAPEKAVLRPALPVSFLPGSNGRTMTNMSYGEQIKHPNWQRRRLELLSAAGWRCECCGTDEVTLHVHHRRYVKGRMAWEYEDHELEALCEVCHLQKHARRDLLDRLMSTGEGSVDLAIGLVAGYLDCNLSLHEDIEADCRAVQPGFFNGQVAGLFSGLPIHVLAHLAKQIDPDKLNPAQRVFVAELMAMKG